MIDALLYLHDNFLSHLPFFSTANELVELFKGSTDFSTFTAGVTEALGEFDFPETFVFDVWGAISDAKAGRI